MGLCEGYAVFRTGKETLERKEVIMKANLEAWQFGEEDGYSDASSNLRMKTEFVFPSNWSVGERNSYVDGYKHGFESGLRMSR